MAAISPVIILDDDDDVQITRVSKCQVSGHAIAQEMQKCQSLPFPERVQHVQVTPENKTNETETQAAYTSPMSGNSDESQKRSSSMSRTVSPLPVVDTTSPMNEPSPKTSPTTSTDGEGSACPSTPKKCQPSSGSATAIPPVVTRFFSDLAEAIALSFPYEQFAKAHHCSVENLKRTLSATVIRPLTSQEPEDTIPDNNGTTHLQTDGSVEYQPTRLASPLQAECRPKPHHQRAPSKGERNSIKPNATNGTDARDSYAHSPRIQETGVSYYQRASIQKDGSKKRQLTDEHSNEKGHIVTPPPSNTRHTLPDSQSPKKQKTAHGCNTIALVHGNLPLEPQPNGCPPKPKAPIPPSETKRYPKLFTHGIEWRPSTDTDRPVRRPITIDPFGNYENADKPQGITLEYLRLGPRPESSRLSDEHMGVNGGQGSKVNLSSLQHAASMETLRAEKEERSRPDEKIINEGHSRPSSPMECDYT